ncbi:MAG: hypothetical protein J6Y62_01850 [Clostridia bacterium]|nr:hypothetical protein [Clostridia bacterium]
MSEDVEVAGLTWFMEAKADKSDFPPSLNKVFSVTCRYFCDWIWPNGRRETSFARFDKVITGSDMASLVSKMKKELNKSLRCKAASRAFLLGVGYEEAGAFRFKRPALGNTVYYNVNQSSCDVSVESGGLSSRAESFPTGSSFHRDVLIYESWRLAQLMDVHKADLFADMPEKLRMAVVETEGLGL